MLLSRTGQCNTEVVIVYKQRSMGEGTVDFPVRSHISVLCQCFIILCGVGCLDITVLSWAQRFNDNVAQQTPYNDSEHLPCNLAAIPRCGITWKNIQLTFVAFSYRERPFYRYIPNPHWVSQCGSNFCLLSSFSMNDNVIVGSFHLIIRFNFNWSGFKTEI